MRSGIHHHDSILVLTEWENAIASIEQCIKDAVIFPVEERRECRKSTRARTAYYREDIEPEEEGFTSHSDARRIQAPQTEIMYGGAGEAIDRLSPMDRILYEAQEFIVVGGFNPNLFRMKDEIGALRATIKKKDSKGRLVPVAFAEPNVGGMDLDAQGLFDPETDLVDMINRYGKAKWSDLKRDQRVNEHQHDAWQTHAPALLIYLADILPDHPMEAASPVLLEPEGQVAQVFIPEHEARAIILLHGTVQLYAVDEGNIVRQLLKDTTDVVEIDGPCHLFLEPEEEAEEDTLLLIGKPVVSDEKLNALEDLHLRAMSTPTPGYPQEHTARLYDNTEENPLDIGEDLEPSENEDSEEFGLRVFSGRMGILPDISQLGAGIPSDWEEQVKLYQKETAGTISLGQWRVSKKLKRLDDELTIRMDSAYLGQGYIPPPLRWERILEEETSSSAEAAEHRASMAEALLKTAKKIDTPQKMQSFRERIFKLNQSDKNLVNLWAPKATFEDTKTKFKARLAGERVKRIHCNICGTVFTSTPRYVTYLAAYRYALGHDEADLRDRIKQAEEAGLPTVASLKQELEALFLIPEYEVKCWHKHDKFAEHAIGSDLYTILQDDPLSAVRSTCKYDKKGDLLVENLLRKKVWHWFERRRKTTLAQMRYRILCLHCNKLHDRTCTKEDLKSISCPACDKKGRFKVEKSLQLTKPEFQDDSRWWKDRTEAFEGLNATQAQWNTIYKQLWIQQDRMQQCYLMQNIRNDKTPLHERKAQWKQERDIVWDALKSAFQAHTTLHELNSFERSLVHQTIAHPLSDKEKAELTKEGKPIPQPGDILQRSPIDRLTFGDETKIRVAIERRRHKIAEDRRASAVLCLRQTATVKTLVCCTDTETCECECLGKESIEAWCYKCNKPSVGKPKLGIVEDDTGYLYIECTNEKCGNKIAIGAHNGLRSSSQLCPKT